MDTAAESRVSEFVSVPSMFIQSGFPLKVEIYLFGPLRRKLVCRLKKGEVLDMNRILEIQRMPPSQVLTPLADYMNALEYLRQSMGEKLFEALPRTVRVIVA